MRAFGVRLRHSSFLPAQNQGAEPYLLEHGHGLKLVGTSARFVITNLNERAIIEQNADCVPHSMTLGVSVASRRDIEARAMVRAVKLHTEGRVMLCGKRTQVFT